MPKAVDFNGRPFHFIGIGGIGMSALAYILTRQNLPVSGSDLRLTHITRRLQEAGARIFWQQAGSNLSYFSDAVPSAPGGPTQPIPQVICSTAIDDRNPEYRAALEMGCPLFHRSDVLASLINRYRSIAVAGTHGKTTTSSMIGHMLLAAGLDPTIVVGGEVESWGGNARLGQGPYLVAEADESDGTLAKLSAAIGVITNIELDHTDHYHTLEDVVKTFQTFQSQCQFLVASLDCQVLRTNLKPDLTYSLNSQSGATYYTSDISVHSQGTTALVWERGQRLGSLNLQVLGHHNLSNALAAVAVGRHLGLTFAVIADGLGQFSGARRRFELRGHCGGIQFVDDYAHHPSEIRATLAAAQLRIGPSSVLDHSIAASPTQPSRVVAVFQPHRFSRTAALLEDFGQAFEDADQVILADIYSAGEVNTYGISGQRVAEVVASQHAGVVYSPTLEEVQTTLINSLRPGDLVLFMGAGNLNQIIPQVMDYYGKNDSTSLQLV
ncbi:MAG: UDP-N-acetylmuramate--L-alanine ligase [Nodosilinea sp. LVE1205-7]|jgi:UDP-N-acetylmuramate--alanine ligase